MNADKKNKDTQNHESNERPPVIGDNLGWCKYCGMAKHVMKICPKCCK